MANTLKHTQRYMHSHALQIKRLPHDFTCNSLDYTAQGHTLLAQTPDPNLSPLTCPFCVFLGSGAIDVTTGRLY